MTKPPIISIYTSESAIRQPGKVVREMVADLVASRELAWRLAVRDVRAQYRQSYLGYLWAFILPLATSLTWIYLSYSGIVRIAETGIPYAVYVLSGTMLWQVFTEALQAPLQQVNASKAMLAKLNFPKEALILSGFFKTFFNASIKIAIIIPVLIILGVNPNWTISLLPLAILTLIIAGMSVGLFLTPMGILYTDIGRLLPLGAQFMMYITPVVFAVPKEGVVLQLFSMNPLTPLIVTAREILTGQTLSMLYELLSSTAIFLLVLILAWFIYRVSLPVLIERVSA